MKESWKLKWRMIRRIIKSDSCILISTKDRKVHYCFSGKEMVMAGLFLRLKTFVPNWYSQVKKKLGPEYIVKK